MELRQELYKYKHISFDLWLTLIKSNPEYKINRNILFREFFSIDKPIEEVALIIRKFDVLTNSINEKITHNFDTFEIYCLILDGLGADINNFTLQQLQDFYLLTENLLMQYKPLLLNANIPVLLKQLHQQGKTMNILSNTAFIKGTSLRKIISYYELDKYFSFQAYSDETGFSKPGMEMYRYAYEMMTALGISAKHDVLHVGDNLVSDYNGAISFGFNAHLITHNSYDDYKLQPA
jgi:putative hydrolase of the HAD superfamily